MQRLLLFAANIDDPEYCRKAAIFVVVLGVLMVGSLIVVTIAGERSDRRRKDRP